MKLYIWCRLWNVTVFQTISGTPPHIIDIWSVLHAGDGRNVQSSTSHTQRFGAPPITLREEWCFVFVCHMPITLRACNALQTHHQQSLSLSPLPTLPPPPCLQTTSASVPSWPAQSEKNCAEWSKNVFECGLACRKMSLRLVLLYCTNVPLTKGKGKGNYTLNAVFSQERELHPQYTLRGCKHEPQHS